MFIAALKYEEGRWGATGMLLLLSIFDLPVPDSQPLAELQLRNYAGSSAQPPIDYLHIRPKWPLYFQMF